MKTYKPHLKFIELYINQYHPHINEITSLDNVIVIISRKHYFFCYGKQAIITIRPQTKKIFVSGGTTKVIPDGYIIRGIKGFSNIIAPMISLTNVKFNDVMMEWICNKHPEIDSRHKLFDFCKTKVKTLNEVKHLFENY